MLKRLCSSILAPVAVGLLLAACAGDHDHAGEIAAAEAAHVGKVADFTLQDLDGNDVSLSDYEGQVVLLNFWATWCGPCKIEMPWFVEFQRKYKDQGFTVLAVSLDEDIDPVGPFVEEYELNFPVVWGNEETAQKFGGVAALPTTLVIDREGMVVDSHTGLISKSIYEEQIEGLL
jgi:peroxiredoxin